MATLLRCRGRDDYEALFGLRHADVAGAVHAGRGQAPIALREGRS
jgi:hypothetical protein